ncbi:MAG: ubiquinol-cytochrome c reductase cytochrome b subunit [Aeromicrobium sp.]|nr:MAG: ubiquinol-cytochrome c reductase cytochrome b subunit [Aeromicrobium sp.]
MATDTYTRIEDSAAGQKLAGPVGWLDDRLGLAAAGKKNLRKVFPEHWSFMLGEIALWSFVVLLLTGVFLTLWFVPSMAEVTYRGSYAPLYGIDMSEAYATTLNISFEVRGGLLIRQIHHWAAAMFIAAMFAHMLRVYFTGAYRKPREINWLIGVGLLGLGTIAGFSGYSLPDDLLSGTGLRFVNGLVRSIPLVGSYIEFFVFGGEFPGTMIIPRLYMAHILLIPAILLGLIGAHMLLLVYHKHTQWPGPGRTNDNVVGYPMLPVYMAKAGGFFFVVFGFLALMGALIQINPVWVYGPYNPAEVTAGSQPDWYMGWVEGAVRVMPALESTFFNRTWTWSVFMPGVLLMGVLFTALGLWPFIERWITGDDREHHLLERPRNAPVRTALGAAAISVYLVFLIGGGNDIIAIKFGMSLNAITWFVRIGIIVVPIIVFMVTKRICIALQRKDNADLTHGYETGVIDRSPSGGYAERHAPLPDGDQFALTSARERLPQLESEKPAATDEGGVRNPKFRKQSLRHKAREFYFDGSVDKPTSHEMDHAAEHLEGAGEHPVAQGEDFKGISHWGVPGDHEDH